MGTRKEGIMLFHITQTHAPDNCPKDEGGLSDLFNPEAEGVKVIGVYGAFVEHTMYYIIEADDLKAIHRFLDPGWTRCDVTITVVGTEL